jgi:hypothetical protein
LILSGLLAPHDGLLPGRAGPETYSEVIEIEPLFFILGWQRPRLDYTLNPERRMWLFESHLTYSVFHQS